jgi:hypothetical protein
MRIAALFTVLLLEQLGLAQPSMPPNVCKENFERLLSFEPEVALRDAIRVSLQRGEITVHCTTLQQAGLKSENFDTAAWFSFTRDPVTGALLPALVIDPSRFVLDAIVQVTLLVVGHEFDHHKEWQAGRGPTWTVESHAPDFSPNADQLRELFVFELGAYLREAVRADRLGWLVFYEYGEACQRDGFWGVAETFADDYASTPAFAPYTNELPSWAHQATREFITIYESQ